MHNPRNLVSHTEIDDEDRCGALKTNKRMHRPEEICSSQEAQSQDP